MKRNLLAMCAAFLLAAQMAVPAFAEEFSTTMPLTATAPTFSVALPTSIPISVTTEGKVITPDNLSIVNNSGGPVEVTSISVESGSAWTLTDYNNGDPSDLLKQGIDKHLFAFGLTVNEDTAATTGAGFQSLSFDKDKWALNPKETAPITCGAIASASTAASNGEAAKLVFTVDWRKWQDPTVHNGVIPEGGTYTQGTMTYSVGATFPAIANGDTYTFGDYKYTYEASNNGWKVAVLDKTKTEYGAILSEINGCSVTNMEFTFTDCTSLTTAPKISDSVTNMEFTFAGCTSLIAVPEIPGSVTNMESTFYGCSSLTAAPEIPGSVTNMGGTFQDCVSLTTAPEIPNSVTNMDNTFYDCTSLTVAPEIPNSVTKMDMTFFRCTSLTGNVVINANPTRGSSCFFGTEKPITLSGASNCLAALASTANKGNVTVAA